MCSSFGANDDNFNKKEERRLGRVIFSFKMVFSSPEAFFTRFLVENKAARPWQRVRIYSHLGRSPHLPVILLFLRGCATRSWNGSCSFDMRKSGL